MTTWASTWKVRTELRLLLRRVRAEYRGKDKRRMVRAIHGALDALVWTPAKMHGLAMWFDCEEPNLVPADRTAAPVGVALEDIQKGNRGMIAIGGVS